MEYFDINNSEIRNRLIFENDLVFAFPSNTPIVSGHTLVCPKRIVSDINKLRPEEVLAIFDLQEKLKKSMIKSFSAQGFNYAWNEGKLAGQTVNHLHLHILPRKENDNGIINYEPREFLYRPGERSVSPEEELNEIALLIKNNL